MTEFVNLGQTDTSQTQTDTSQTQTDTSQTQTDTKTTADTSQTPQTEHGKPYIARVVSTALSTALFKITAYLRQFHGKTPSKKRSLLIHKK